MTYIPQKDSNSKPNLMSGNVSIDTPISNTMFSTTLTTTGLMAANLPSDANGNNYGYLQWSKDSDSGHSTEGRPQMIDSIRAGTIVSSDTLIESTGKPTTALDATNNVSWEWLTTKKTPGTIAGVGTSIVFSGSPNTTNHGENYICHYNPITKFCITVYEGSGLINHRIPTHLDVKTDFWIIKRLSGSGSLECHYGSGKTRMDLDTTMVEDIDYHTFPEVGYNQIAFDAGVHNNWNGSGEFYVMYGWANSNMTQIGEHIGTGIVGNHVDCNGRKPAWLLIKNKDGTTRWNIHDNKRITTSSFFVDGYEAEQISAGYQIDFESTGFTINGTSSQGNTVNECYLYMVCFDTDKDDGGTEADLPDSADTLELNSGYLPYASGVNTSGQVNRIEYKDGTISLEAGSFAEGDNWLYKVEDEDDYRVTPYKPRIGVADTWGESSQGDIGKRTTARHTDYMSATGVVSANSENNTTVTAWKAFNGKMSWVIDVDDWQTSTYGAGPIAAELEYKPNVPKILKSFRMVGYNSSGSQYNYMPEAFTIKATNDNWVTSATLETYTTYTTDNAVKPVNNFSDLVTISNTTAYKEYKFDITSCYSSTAYVILSAVELNFYSPEDYFDIEANQWCNYLGTPYETPITYICNVKCDHDGNPYAIEAMDNTSSFKDVVIEGDLTLKGNIIRDEDQDESSDAIGWKEYYAGSDFEMKGTGWALSHGVAIPYQTSNGIWRCQFNWVGGTGATTDIDIKVSGILSSPYKQAGTGGAAVGQQGSFVYSVASTNRLVMYTYNAGTATEWWGWIDIELVSKPTWAD